jgi:hypothetical protein
MLGLVCGSFFGLLVFAWVLLRVVVLGFSLCILGLLVFRVLGVFSCILGGGFFCSLDFMGVSSGFWVFGGLGYCVGVGPCGFFFFFLWASWVVPVYLRAHFVFLINFFLLTCVCVCVCIPLLENQT